METKDGGEKNNVGNVKENEEVREKGQDNPCGKEQTTS